MPACCSLIKPYLIHLRPPSVTDALISETVNARRDPSLLFLNRERHRVRVYLQNFWWGKKKKKNGARRESVDFRSRRLQMMWERTSVMRNQQHLKANERTLVVFTVGENIKRGLKCIFHQIIQIFNMSFLYFLEEGQTAGIIYPRPASLYVYFADKMWSRK